MTHRRVLLSLAVSVSLPVLAQFSSELLSFIPSAHGPVTDAATLRYIKLQPGSGKPALPGRKYTVHYTGWLRDGTKFDSSLERKEPIDFVQGRRQVIAGWDPGFEGMKTGGRRRLFIPYQLAYGEKGTGPIPPKAELIFDVELLDVTEVPEVTPAVEILAPFDELRQKVCSLRGQFLLTNITGGLLLVYVRWPRYSHTVLWGAS